MLHIIKKVQHIDNYKLKLTFDDSCVKIVDFQKRLQNAKNMFLALREIDYFKKVKCDGTTIVWPNGLDLCPDALYDIGTEINENPPKKTIKKRVRISSPSAKPRLKAKG